MARGRMISKSLSTSEKRAALHHVAGKLAEFCQALYPLLIAHSDDWGCLQGDAFTVKHLVDPTSPRKLPDFDAALTALHNVGLITWYEVDGKWYVYIVQNSKHQDLKGHDKDGRKRPIPPPPENPKKFAVGEHLPPNLPKFPLREEKRTEEKRTEPIQSPHAATGEADSDLDDGAVTNADVGRFLKRFCELFTLHRHGAKYVVQRQADVPLVKRLLKVYDAARLEKLAVVLFTTNDEWVKGTDRGIRILSVKASWLDGLLADYEAEHGAIKVAS